MEKILKQTSYLLFAQVLGKIIGFFYTLFLAKNLGVEGFGLYTVALAYFSIVSSLADFGFNRYITREVTKENSKASELFYNIGLFRLTISAVIFSVFALILYLIDPDKFRVSLILIAVLSILPQSIAQTLDGIFIAFGKIRLSSLAIFLASLFNAFIGFFLVTYGFAEMGAVNALLISQFIYAGVLFLILLFSKKLKISFIKFSIIKNALKGGLPYGILSILGLIYFRIDAILLSYLKGSFETGIYGAAYRSLEVLIFIPTSLSTVLFPKLTTMHEGGVEKIKQIFLKSIKMTLLVSVVIVIGYLIVLPQIIKIFLVSYEPSISAIRILSLSIPFMFLHMVLSSFVLSSEKYLKGIILLSLIPVIFNIILNFIFIPVFGYIGASWITVLSDILSFTLIFLFINKKIFR